MAEMLFAKSAQGSLWTLVPKDVTPVDEDTVPPFGSDDVLTASRRSALLHWAFASDISIAMVARAA